MGNSLTNISDKRIRLAIRISNSNMFFSVGDPLTKDDFTYEIYNINKGISIAANLREAFKTSELLLSGYKRSIIILDSPAMIIPIEEYDEQNVEDLYKFTHKLNNNETIINNAISELNLSIAYKLNKDLQLVLNDHFDDIHYLHIMQSVWIDTYHYHYKNESMMLFVYFHNKKFEVFSFKQNRIYFYNSYNYCSINDTTYYILCVWKQLGIDIKMDILYLFGDIPNREELIASLNRFLYSVKDIYSTEKFTDSCIINMKELPYDLITLYKNYK